MSWKIPATACLGFFALACGSKVTVVQDGTGGAAAASGHSSTASAPTAPTATDSSVSSANATGAMASNSASEAASASSAASGGVGGGGGASSGYAILEVFRVPFQQTSAFAAFWQPSPSSQCKTLAMDNSCQVVSCPEQKGLNQVDAGDVQIQSPSGSVVLMWQGNQYSSPGAPFLKFGEPVAFSVQGDATVPPFKDAVVFPAPTDGFWPDANKIDSSQPLPVAWSGDQGTEFFEIVSSSQPVVELSCSWPAALNKGVVPALMMAQLPKGSAAFAAGNGNWESKLVQGWTFAVYATSVSVESFNATIQ